MAFDTNLNMFKLLRAITSYDLNIIVLIIF